MTKALIVEDDKPIALLLESLIKPLVDETFVCYTMACALEYIKTHNNPDIVTLDLNLPDSRWQETLHHIADLKAENTVLFVVTGILGEKDLVKKSIASGADAFIEKSEIMFKREGGILNDIRDTFRSLVRSPEKYKSHGKILQAITDILETKNMKQTLALFILLAFCGCETVTNPDGSSTTRFDTAGFAKAGTTVLDMYQRGQQIHDGWTIIGHDPATGAPIYGYPPRR